MLAQGNALGDLWGTSDISEFHDISDFSTAPELCCDRQNFHNSLN